MSSRSTRSSIWQPVLGLMMLAGIGYLLWVGLSGITAFVTSVQNPAAGAVVAASIAGTVSIIIHVVGKIYERRAAAEQALRAKKSSFYELFIGSFMEWLLTTRSEDPLPPLPTAPGDPTQLIRDEDGRINVLKLLLTFNREALLWGSDDVLVAWSRLRSSSARGNLKPVESLNLYARLVLALRKEYGHKNRHVTEAIIAKTFVNDYDEMMLELAFEKKQGGLAESEATTKPTSGAGSGTQG